MLSDPDIDWVSKNYTPIQRFSPIHVHLLFCREGGGHTFATIWERVCVNTLRP